MVSPVSVPFRLAAGVVVGGRYRLDAPLGEGGAGVVWAATRDDGGQVALKFLRLQGSSFDARRLQREAEALAMLRHPHIVQFHELILDPLGRPALVVDLLRGETLAAALGGGPVPLARAAAWLGPVVDALHFAHLRGAVHRDLKPSNLFLERRGGEVTPWVLDFGLVKLLQSAGLEASKSLLTQSGDLLGTPRYMAPEQLGGERSIDHRADIWALGVILYECLAGVGPVAGATLGQIMKAVLTGGVTPLCELELGLPAGLVSLVDRMLVINREHRLDSLVVAREILRAASGVAGYGAGGVLKASVQMTTGELPLLVLGDASGALRAALAMLGLPLVASPGEAHALRFAEEHPISLFLYAGSTEGALRFLQKVEAQHPDTPVLVIADASEEAAALDALRAGAADVLLGPVEAEQLRLSISKGLARRPSTNPPPPSTQGGLVFGTSAAMQGVEAMVRRVAGSSATVLIRGESGTGKEMIARALHQQSPRAPGPLVKLHCAALPESLIEAELFGHEKGAFTGAIRRRPGRIELAHGGTLFLDEIGDVPLTVQVKLLRVLQEREFERVGGTETVRVDVRLLAATHRNLEAMIKQGQFREDLFYRLNVIPLWLPPLRARREDIPPLARHFCAQFAAHHGKPGLTLSEGALDALRRERWPGNVRQLQNVIERLVVLAQGPLIGAEDIRDDGARAEAFETQAPTLTGLHEAPGGMLDEATLSAERKVIEAALARASGNRTLAARLLGVSRRTLYNKLQQLGISNP